MLGHDRAPTRIGSGHGDLHDAIAAEAERTAFSGVVRVDRGAETLVAQAFGWPTAAARCRIPWEPDSRSRVARRASRRSW